MNGYAIPLGTDGMQIVRTLPGPVERLWDYLTDSRKRATWLAAGEFDLRVGGRIELDFDNDSLSPGACAPAKHADEHGSFTGTITRCEPPRVLAFTWAGWKEESEVTFELTPAGSEVELKVTHVRLTNRGLRIGVMSGWDTHIGILAARLRGVEPEPFWPTHERLEREYGARI